MKEIQHLIKASTGILAALLLLLPVLAHGASFRGEVVHPDAGLCVRLHQGLPELADQACSGANATGPTPLVVQGKGLTVETGQTVIVRYRTAQGRRGKGVATVAATVDLGKGRGAVHPLQGRAPKGTVIIWIDRKGGHAAVLITEEPIQPGEKARFRIKVKGSATAVEGC